MKTKSATSSLSSGSMRVLQMHSRDGSIHEIVNLQNSVEYLRSKLDQNKYHSIKQRDSDAAQLAKTRAYLEQMLNVVRSIEGCQSRIDQNDYVTTKSREMDKRRIARSNADLAVMTLCNYMHTRAASIVRK